MTQQNAPAHKAGAFCMRDLFGVRVPHGVGVRARFALQDHFAEELSLKTLAEVACVSPHYFSAYFKAETGQNYKAYLIRVRMENALQMVLNTDMKAYEIAQAVGYNNVRRFVDAFRAAYQMSPTDYRKLYKKGE